MKFIFPNPSLKERIVYSFLIYSLVSFFIAVTCFLLFRRIEQSDGLSRRVSRLSISAQEVVRNADMHLVFDITYKPPNFNKQTKYLTRYFESFQRCESITDSLSKESKLIGQEKLLSISDSLHMGIADYGNEFERLRKAIYKIDYAHTDSMRFYIHQLMKKSHLNQVNLLLLRRHEKDYFLRADSTYLHYWDSTFTLTKKEIEQKASLSFNDRQYSIKTLERYRFHFKEIVKLEIASGRNDNSGLTLLVKSKGENIIHTAYRMQAIMDQEKDSLMQWVQLVVVLMVTISVMLSMIVSLSMRRMLS